MFAQLYVYLHILILTLILILINVELGTSTKSINVLLMEQIERDSNQWLAVVAWANQLIVQDKLLPAGYTFKYVRVIWDYKT
jgi:hypothetical protein